MYLMRIQELGSDKVTVATAKGKISAIIKQLGMLKLHVISYVEHEIGQDEILLINTNINPRKDTMSNFSVVVNKDREYMGIQQFDEIAECTSFSNACDYGNVFEIHKDKHTTDYLRGEKRENGHIDWVRVNY